MASSKESLSSLTALDDKRALLLTLLEDRARLAVAAPQGKPLSQGQQALWYLDALTPNTSVYNFALFMPLTAETAPATVRQVLHEVVERHPMLRSTFEVYDGEPVRFAHPAGLVPFEEVDAQGESLRQIKQRITEVFGLPFNLKEGPVARAYLFMHAGGHHIFLLVAHHIVSDAVSMSLLEDEMRRRIAAHERGHPPLPLTPAASFSDYVRWHEELLAGPEGERLWTYWKHQFSDGVPSAMLLADVPAHPDRELRKQTLGFRVDAALSEALLTFTQREGLTLFVVLLSAFAIVLRRHADQDAIGIGTAAMGRTNPGFRKTVGYFANALLLKVDTSGDPSFKALLRRVQSTVIGALEHQDFPLPLLVERLHKEQGRRSFSSFQVMFMHQHLESLTKVAGVSIKDRAQMDIDESIWELLTAIVHPGGDSELLLYLCTVEESVLGSFVYDADLFSKSTIEGLLEDLQEVLREALSEPDRALSVLLKGADRMPNPSLPPYGAGDVAACVYPRDRSVHDLFAEQAAQTPGAVAIVQGKREVTYDLLDRWANGIAQQLIARGLQPGGHVALLCERSAEAIAGMLGTLKAGGVFIPIDVQNPPDRIRALLRQAKAEAVLYTGRWSDACEQSDAVPTLQLETLIPAPGRDTDVCLPEVGAENPAYIMFTSGSTGTPKGVVIPHRGIVRLVKETDYVSLTDTDVVAHASSIAFDASTFEIWGALLHGGCIAILPKEVLLSPGRFAAELQAQQISTIFLTTALFNVMASAMPGAFKGFRYVLFGGEAANPDAVRHVLQNGPPQALLHVYGPTENTTFTTWYRVTEVPEGASTVPIGRAVANTQVFVLDCDGQPVPPGATGELFIGGDGLALGYLDHPDLTNQAFVNRNVGTDPPQRMYKTGDLVRLQEDGVLVFDGRMDRQVKLRGFRIELDEVERELRKHAGVDACVVDACVVDTGPRAEGELQLLAYVTLHPTSDAEPDTLRAFLDQHLPPYMIPTHIEVLESLPLNLHGKVDRAALPKPVRKGTPADAPFVAPDDLFEFQLTELWENVLGVEPIGKQDNFFDLGGHSLMAARLVARIETELGQRIPISALLMAPTIETLAEALHAHADRPQWPTAVPLRTKGTKRPLFCVPGAGGHAMQFYQLSRHLEADQPVYGFEPRETKRGRLLESTQDMATRYVSAMRTVQPQGPYLLAGFSSGGTIALEMAQQVRQQGEEVLLLALLDTLHPAVLHTINRHQQQQELRDGTYGAKGRWGVALLGRHYAKVRSALRYAERTLAYYAAKALKKPVSTSLFTTMQAGTASRYQPAPYHGRMVILRTIWSTWSALVPKDLGWGEVARGGIEIHPVSGVHKEILKKDHNVRHLAGVLNQVLEHTHLLC